MRAAVVDSEGRAIGVKALRVVDGSLQPILRRADANIPIIVAAETIAASILNRKERLVSLQSKEQPEARTNDGCRASNHD